MRILLTAGTLRERLEHARRGVEFLGIFSCLWNLVVFPLVGLGLIDAVPRGRRP